MSRRGDWMQTFTGRQFWPLDPRPEDVDIEDIAHHLALTCRFAGACREFYSVAQHSILVASNSPTYPLIGLLHDAAEAYVGDMIRSIKHAPGMEQYCEAEKGVQRAIFQAFGVFAPIIPDEVKRADNVVLFTEARDLLVKGPSAWAEPIFEPLPEEIVPWHPDMAEEQFLLAFETLTTVAVDPVVSR